jgi:alpha-N-acetylglucosaminidase
MRKTPYRAIAFVLLLPFSCAKTFAAAGQNSSSQPPRIELRAVAALARRVVPWISPSLVLERIPKDRGRDVFELATANGKLIIRASDAPSAAFGLNWYLKYYCHRSISHLGNNIAPVSSLPTLHHPVRITTPFRYRYNFNYCTLDYSLAFADWAQWQREIDWMALNGVNLALAVNGTEAIWQNTLRRIGYTESEILDFIPSPAYEAWWLMGNLEGWGDPVTQRTIDDRKALELKILARMRDLGIEPVLQGFYGMVPASLSKKFPSANIVEQGTWNSFRRPRILLSTDPLFARMASIYYDEVKKLYGPVRFFGGDLFHEGGSTTGLDVPTIARGVQTSMLNANSNAIWVLQAWQGNPKDELLDGLDRTKILVLNLSGRDWETRQGFHGSPWVWGMINNFGENTGLFGDLNEIATEPPRALATPAGQTMMGIGAIMEGIKNNPVVYDLLFEMAWQPKPVDVHQRIGGYVKYRYGGTSPALEKAWQRLVDTVYRSGSGAQSIFCARPSLDVKGASTWGTTKLAYDTATLEQAAREFVSVRAEFGANDAYQADAVDLVRQVISNRGLAAYQKMVSAYAAKDKPRFNAAASLFLNLLRDEDLVLATRKEFLLGRWLEEAKASAHTEEESAANEKNARTLITYWGPDDPSTDVHDYACKEWSGLLQGFYRARWEMFIRELNSRLDGNPPKEPDYFAFERQWTRQRDVFPATPSGDPATIAAHVLTRVTH